MRNLYITRASIITAYKKAKEMKEHNLTIAMTKSGKAILYNDPDMPIISSMLSEVVHTFPIVNKLAAKALLREYRGKGELNLKKAAKEALAILESETTD